MISPGYREQWIRWKVNSGTSQRDAEIAYMLHERNLEEAAERRNRAERERDLRQGRRP